MNIVIEGAALDITRTGVSDAALLASTGCSAAEFAAILRRDASPNQIARALHPMLGENAPAPVDLAEAIAGMNAWEIAGQTADLLAAEPAVAAVPNA